MYYHPKARLSLSNFCSFEQSLLPTSASFSMGHLSLAATLAILENRSRLVLGDSAHHPASCTEPESPFPFYSIFLSVSLKAIHYAQFWQERSGLFFFNIVGRSFLLLIVFLEVGFIFAGCITRVSVMVSCIEACLTTQARVRLGAC